MPSVFSQFLVPFFVSFPPFSLFLLTSQEVYDALFLVQVHVAAPLVYPADSSATTLALHSKMISLLLCHLYLQVKKDASWLKND
jgi:hypothetical protein